LHSRRFTDIIGSYPETQEPLRIRKLTGSSLSSLPDLQASSDIFIIVHPAYSLFFHDKNRSKYLEAKFDLMSAQLHNEAQFIADAARAGKIVILIVPGNYNAESEAPGSYTSYLNKTAGTGQSVFYLFSESANSGSISTDDMVNLYRFLDGAKAGKVLIGGGYIGRCQKEFYGELTTFFTKAASFIVPEISTISPDDISETEAKAILDSIKQHDYRLVKKFIDKKLENPNLLSIPPKKKL
jgi:hypothetical protein